MSDDTDPVADESSLDDLAERDDLADEAEGPTRQICSRSTKTPRTNPATTMRKSAGRARRTVLLDPSAGCGSCPRWR